MNFHTQAVEYIHSGNYEKSLELLEKLEKTPDVLNDRAVALYQLGRPEEALQLLDEALDADPGHAAAILNARYMRLALDARLAPSRHKVLEDWGRPPYPEPAVSVIIPTYNRPHFIKDALRSVLVQTRSDLEVVVVNDGGSRDCEAIIKNVGGDKIRYLYIEHGGLSAALNAGITHAQGRYVAYLDDDDIYYPRHVETLAGHLDEHPEATVVYSHAIRVWHTPDGDGWRVADRKVYNREPFERERLLRYNCMPVLTVMHRREVIDEVGGFNEALEASMDWEMWIRMSEKHEIHRVDSVTCEFNVRVGAGQMTANASKMRRSHNTVFFLHKLLSITSFMPGNPGYARAMKAIGKMASQYPDIVDIVDLYELACRKPYACFYRMGKDFGSIGEKRKARRAFLQSLLLAPWEPRVYSKLFFPLGRPPSR